MIKRFHRSLKSTLRACLASSDWFPHLPLVLLGLRMVPKDNTGLSVSKAVYGSPLTVPGEFLGSSELPLSTYFSKIGGAVARFAVPPPHHVLQSPPHQLPAALMSARYVFVREDASIPSPAPLYHSPYLVLEWRDKFFCLQIGSRTDVVLIDRLNPVFSVKPVEPALPPAHGRPALQVLDPILRPPVVLDPPSTALPARPGQRVCFQLPPSVPAHRNPY